MSSVSANASDLATGADNDDVGYEYFRDLMRFVVQRRCIPIIASVGIVVNCLSMVVLTRKRMRSSTNCYLTALAFFDAAYLMFNFSLALMHHEGFLERRSYIDYVPWGFPLTDLCSNTSVWLIVSFTVERCIAVCYPLRGKRMCTIKRAKWVIVGVFAGALACSLPTFFEWKTGPVEDAAENATYHAFYQSALSRNETYQRAFYWFTSLMFSLVPIVMLIVFNSILVLSVHQSQRQRRQLTSKGRGGGGGSSDNQQNQELRITIMLIIVVVVFLVCQLPSAVLLIWSKDIPERTARENLGIGLNNISNLLMAINATCNFFLYCFLSDRFRRTFVQIVCPGCRSNSPLHTYVAGMTTSAGGGGHEQTPGGRRGRLQGGENCGKKASPQPSPRSSSPPRANNSYHPLNAAQPNGKPSRRF
ncbi:PREDICTED: FMRFamide receptor-like [Priapulus caudatus]|uniref:FMRFamide receptor-like n=1 Tax=Priapulus caudatus TaxID=37621 RepID=A0ABM1FBD2_PRICU|nr:PREDICTED: FMRFamide receptor-like [Priapulus caudatus]